MCGRYYQTFDKQQIAEALRARATGDPLAYIPGYNVAPRTTQPVLRQERGTFERELVSMGWGLVGFGYAKIDPRRSTFNARSEGLANSSLWKRPLHKQRCVVPMNGYYEWRKSDRQAFRFTTHDKLLGTAGLWDAWKSPQDEWLQNFTIITTDPNTAAESVHNRMPVILHPKDCRERSAHS